MPFRATNLIVSKFSSVMVLFHGELKVISLNFRIACNKLRKFKLEFIKIIIYLLFYIAALYFINRSSLS